MWGGTDEAESVSTIRAALEHGVNIVYQTPDMIAQHHLLNEVADLVDAGILRTTLAEESGAINAANLRRVHALVESGRAIAKEIVPW
jgi:hypothetical protein